MESTVVSNLPCEAHGDLARNPLALHTMVRDHAYSVVTVIVTDTLSTLVEIKKEQ